MQFADGPAIAYKHPGTNHREGNIEFKYLLQGQEDSPQNYALVVTKTTGRFYTGPHRHNFDQIRFVLSGNFRDDTGKLTLSEGGVAYYPESTPYDIDSGDTEVLLLQFGGASGNGFTGYDKLRSAYPVLADKGTFKDGVFRWHTPPEGGPNQQDSYEAMWEHIHGKPLTYPKARYRHAVSMNPAGFEWMPTEQAGLQEREFGRFTERHIVAAQVRVEAGAQVQLRSPDTIRLFYVLEGTGRAGEHALTPGCAFEVVTGTEVTVSAAETLVLMDLHLPHFS
jgi:quercetin dioxygenase-like cupin family protein